MKIAINGLGRIGRVTMRHILDDSSLELVAVNDLVDIETVAHLIEFDSVYRGLNKPISAHGDTLVIDGKEIVYTQIKNPSEAKWGTLGVDVVIDCTGIFKTYEAAHQHIDAGAKKVVLSYPTSDAKIKSVVLGVNDKDIQNDDKIISNASCTTNCSAPIIKLIHNKWGIKRGFLSTIHAFTADQNINDAAHKDLRRARAASTNIIPTSTGAAKAISLVFPEVEGKIDGSAYRVPVITGSCIDVVLELEKEFSVEEINQEIKRAAENEMKNIVEYTEKPIVSSDIIGNPASSIFDAALTQDSNGLLKIVSWYDNEYGYSKRLVDLIHLLK